MGDVHHPDIEISLLQLQVLVKWEVKMQEIDAPAAAQRQLQRGSKAGYPPAVTLPGLCFLNPAKRAPHDPRRTPSDFVEDPILYNTLDFFGKYSAPKAL